MTQVTVENYDGNTGYVEDTRLEAINHKGKTYLVDEMLYQHDPRMAKEFLKDATKVDSNDILSAQVFRIIEDNVGEATATAERVVDKSLLMELARMHWDKDKR